jgi:hypothetical protein
MLDPIVHAEFFDKMVYNISDFYKRYSYEINERIDEQFTSISKNPEQNYKSLKPGSKDRTPGQVKAHLKKGLTTEVFLIKQLGFDDDNEIHKNGTRYHDVKIDGHRFEIKTWSKTSHDELESWITSKRIDLNGSRWNHSTELLAFEYDYDMNECRLKAIADIKTGQITWRPENGNYKKENN